MFTFFMMKLTNFSLHDNVCLGTWTYPYKHVLFEIMSKFQIKEKSLL